MNIKLILVGLAALAIVTAMTFGYTHYRNVLAEKEALAAELNLKIIENAEISESRDMFKEHSEILQRALISNAEESRKSRESDTARKEKVARHVPNFERIAKRDKQKLADAVNRGTADIFRLLEQATAIDPGDGGAAAAGSPAPAGPD